MKLKIKDKEYGLQWGLGAIEMYCETMFCGIEGLDLVFVNNREQNKALVTLIHSAMRNYAELNDQELDVSYRQLQAWLDEAPDGTLLEIITDFKNSKYLGKTIEEYFLAGLSEGSAKPAKK